MSSSTSRAQKIGSLTSAIPGLPDSTVVFVRELAQAGEWEVAIEFLCDQIFESSIILDDALRAQFLEVGRRLNVSKAYLDSLP